MLIIVEKGTFNAHQVDKVRGEWYEYARLRHVELVRL